MLRATQLGITNQSIQYGREQLDAIARLQRQLSSGLRFERTSEAPLDASRVSSLRNTLQNLASDQSQLPAAQQILNHSVSELLAIQNISIRAKQIALDGVQQFDNSTGEILAKEVQGLIDNLHGLVNEKSDGQFLFSGKATQTPPISFNHDSRLEIPSVGYAGSRERMSISVTTTIPVDVRYSAEEILFARDRGQPLIFGNTGVQSGQGTDNGIGRASIDVVHDTTTYDPSAGISPGISSNASDTIVGQLGTHTLTVIDTSGTGQFGTVSLNGGAAVDFTDADTDLEVIGPFGEKVFIDTTAIVPGFNGTIDIESTATISTDGGASSDPVAFDPDQIVVNAINQQVTHLDTAGITRTGRDFIEYTGTADLFTALYELKDDLLNSRNLDESALSKSLARRADDIERASNRVLEIVGEQSIWLENLQLLENRQADQELELVANITEIQAVDVAQTISELQFRQSIVEANFASFSIVQQLSILDFLG